MKLIGKIDGDRENWRCDLILLQMLAVRTYNIFVRNKIYLASGMSRLKNERTKLASNLILHEHYDYQNQIYHMVLRAIFMIFFEKAVDEVKIGLFYKVNIFAYSRKKKANSRTQKLFINRQ